jgi:hypothetical protein
MAVRHGRGARLRRVARGGAGYVALAAALYAAAALVTTWPAVRDFRTAFLSGGASGHGEAAPGDHLQTEYHWWLVGHQLEHGRAPWLDPYSFRPEADAQPNFAGWPFGLPFWPLDAAFGPVVGWNLLQLLVYVAAGLLACAWLRELGLPRAPAVAGGLVFAIAPYRVAQSVGHLLGPISIVLPLMLWSIDRARRGSAWWLALAAAAVASVPLSGQVHLALGAIPFFVAYALVRLGVRSRRMLVAVGGGVVAAVGAGVLVRQTLIAGSTQSGGRSLDEVSSYSARWGDFVARNIDHARSEQFVFFGWATPIVALVGLVLLLRARRFGLAALLGLGALIPMLLAVGTRLPVYSALWHAFPPFRFPRVPERLLPIACLCLGALVAFAVARSRSLVVTLIAIAVLLVDLHSHVYGASAADANNTAYAAVPAREDGRLLELPIFDPGVHYGSVYLWYDQKAQRERPAGYSTTAPRAAKRLTQRLERLNCGDWSDGTAALLDRLGVSVITVHNGLFMRNSAVLDRRSFALRGLLAHGWGLENDDGVVWTLTRDTSTAYQLVETNPKRQLVFCQGWYGNTGHGWPMSETHAPFWVYGSGRLQLRFTPFSPARRVRVDGRDSLQLRGRGWHLVTVDVAHLTPVEKRRVGATILSVATCPSRDSRNRRTASCR